MLSQERCSRNAAASHRKKEEMNMTFTMKTIASIINDNTPEHITATVEGCWEDYGARLWWETIIITSKNTRYQALSPRQHSDIECGFFTLDDIQKLIDTAIRLCR